LPPRADVDPRLDTIGSALQVRYRCTAPTVAMGPGPDFSDRICASIAAAVRLELSGIGA
jgi:hypothetical protein